jgi:murein DD-endopeptidase MepM/ murein hydrolase activator NlpD
MAEKEKQKKWLRKLKYTYRLVFYNDSTFEEVWHVRVTMLNVLSTIGTLLILLIGGSIALVMFTPMREWVPGYPTQAMRNQLITNVLQIDSLENELQLHEKYFNAMKAFIAGREPEMQEPLADTSTSRYSNITFTRSEEDSLMRKQVEEEERFNFQAKDNGKQKATFFKPVEGVVTNRFDLKSAHYGIDLVAKPNAVVKAALDGTVILASWTVETGYVIELQHDDNVITVYKHNASLMKKQGDHVKAGEAIAIVGNTGDLTTGPHLHFEIWQKGKPVNPETYIAF